MVIEFYNQMKSSCKLADSLLLTNIFTEAIFNDVLDMCITMDYVKKHHYIVDV